MAAINQDFEVRPWRKKGEAKPGNSIRSKLKLSQSGYNTRYKAKGKKTIVFPLLKIRQPKL